MGETAASKAIADRLEREPDLELFRNNVGSMFTRGRMIEFGLRSKAHRTGSSDRIGILGPHGRWFCLEVKARGAKPQKHEPEQKRFRATIRRLGGFAAVVHDVAEAEAALDRARKGARG
jgi:hypothetical protein